MHLLYIRTNMLGAYYFLFVQMPICIRDYITAHLKLNRALFYKKALKLVKLLKDLFPKHHLSMYQVGLESKRNNVITCRVFFKLEK